ncbi:glycosyltransferase [Klenkia sp. LSe6-5]|uniref:Glycosyltransferase n=1 Tax=Klenkia sesuvii TaxID=3103137 RepID=A0ABU8DVD7_9ACTN
MKVAIAHDYLTQRGGAERVVLSLCRAFPNAAVHTLLFDPKSTFPEFESVDVRVSPLNRVGVIRRNHRLGLPVMPLAASLMRIDADVVVASSSGWSHGFAVPNSTKKLVYCHNPPRWVYQTSEYLGGSAGGLANIVARSARTPLRRWDRAKAATVDLYLANSTVVSKRISCAYGVDAEILFPPVALRAEPRASAGFVANLAGQPFFLCVSRLLPYKNVDRVIGAAERVGVRVVVVGAGPERARLSGLVTGRTSLLSGLSDSELCWLYANCSAVVGASYEDFGLTPIEGAFFGKPAVVLGRGGYLDTVIDGVTGIHVPSPDIADLAAGMVESLGRPWDSGSIRAHAERFSEDHFIDVVRERAASLFSGLYD